MELCQEYLCVGAALHSVAPMHTNSDAAPPRISSLPPTPASFADVIALWPTAVELAAALGVEAVTVRAWRVRGIPAQYWLAVAEAARATGRKVDERILAELASVRRLRSSRVQAAGTLGAGPRPS